MPMTREQFDTLVERLERSAERHPGFYKLKLGAFASLGYLYVLGALVLLLAASGAVIAILVSGKAFALVKVLLPIFALIVVVFRSLWVTLGAPQGLKLERREHSALFAMVDEVRREAEAPRVHEVLLTNDVNAAVVQVPRLGMFGWQKNYLILGLPLMQLMSMDELKAVLAHELGHLSGAHGKFGAWIYRVRAGWARLNERLQATRQWGSFIFVPFFEWYAPKFAAYSFVQARQQEYEADRLAAETVGPEALGNALVRLDLKSQDLETDFWPSIYSDADRSAEPAELPYAALLQPERRGFLPQAPEQLRQSLARDTSTADTHPCLRDRLAALKVAARVPEPIDRSAADELFVGKLAALVEHFDAEWRSATKEWWQGRHAHMQNGRKKLATLAQRPPAEMTDEELYEYALAVEEFEDADKAFELYEKLVLERGSQRGAKFAYARLLLRRGDESAIDMLDQVMLELPETTLPGCAVIVDYLLAHGREADAKPYINRYHDRQRAEAQARI